MPVRLRISRADLPGNFVSEHVQHRAHPIIRLYCFERIACDELGQKTRSVRAVERVDVAR